MRSRRKTVLNIIFVLAVLALSLDMLFSFRVGREYGRLQTLKESPLDLKRLVAGRVETVVPDKLASVAAQTPDSSAPSPEIPQSRIALVTLARLNAPELRQRPELPSGFTRIGSVYIYSLEDIVGDGGYLMELDCEANAPRWWARRTSRTLTTGERQHRVWGFYFFGGQVLTNWDPKDTRLAEALQRPASRFETVYRVRYTPQEPYVWGFFEGALYQQHSYTEAGVLEQSLALFRTREEAARAVLWLQRADGVLEHK
ncbi:MAG: hypothetical protein WHS44_07400 [Fimbriimonadales bacterium]|nr:MAG: hypothetical protein KatS3mg018_1281 [Fimbriimonadales bacterium]